MRKTGNLLFILILTFSLISCNSEPPPVCDCAKNNIRKETAEYNKEMQKKCDKHFNKLTGSEKEQWLNEINACLANDPYYQKILADKKKKFYQSSEYLYGLWSCVVRGIGIRIKIHEGNSYYWQDDLSGFSTGTWQGTNNDLKFYEKGFPTGSGYVDANGQLICTIAGNRFRFSKE